jgi:hypothetical protein
VKLPAHRAGLPGKVISFYIVSLDPAYKAGLAGHVPVNIPLAKSKGKVRNGSAFFVAPQNIFKNQCATFFVKALPWDTPWIVEISICKRGLNWIEGLRTVPMN